MNDLANLSTDLRRISYWKLNGQDAVANSFLKKALERYGHLPDKIGKYGIEQTLVMIQVYDRAQAAELAMTASVILKNRYANSR